MGVGGTVGCKLADPSQVAHPNSGDSAIAKSIGSKFCQYGREYRASLVWM